MERERERDRARARVVLVVIEVVVREEVVRVGGGCAGEGTCGWGAIGREHESWLVYVVEIGTRAMWVRWSGIQRRRLRCRRMVSLGNILSGGWRSDLGRGF